MPIREWKETIRVNIQCSEAELPYVAAALPRAFRRYEPEATV